MENFLRIHLVSEGGGESVEYGVSLTQQPGGKGLERIEDPEAFFHRALLSFLFLFFLSFFSSFPTILRRDEIGFSLLNFRSRPVS